MSTRSDSSRIESFSDAVFAFSATLLVVSLEVPQTYGELVRDLQGFIAFGVSFGALMLIWVVHRGFFRRYAIGDGVTIALNSLLLFVVLFYVYPLKFVSRGVVALFQPEGPRALGMIDSLGELSGLFILYGTGFSAIFLCFALLYRHAAMSREVLGLTEDQHREAQFLFRHYLIFVAVGIVSIVVAWSGALLTIGFPGWLYAVLGPLCYLHAELSKRRLKIREPAPSQ